MSKYYLRVEGVNLNNFVYDTADLSTIRGGSLMLLNSMDYLQKKEFSTKLEPISTGASAGLFSFDAANDESAENLCQEVEAALKKGCLTDEKKQEYAIKHATFVVDIQIAGDNFLYDSEALLAKNRWKQMQQPSLSVPSQNNTASSYCQIDLVRPGISKIYRAGEKQVASDSVKTRREYGSEKKLSFYRQQTGLRDEIPQCFVNDLDELTSDKNQGNLNRKMAVIYLDGNGFSKIRHENCKTVVDYKKFDKEVKEKRRNMLRSLLTDVIMQDKKGWLCAKEKCRMETLLWGGDEIIWVVPSWQGWKTLSFFYQYTKEWEFCGAKLTHAAAIVFCHHNAAITRVKDLAYNLANLAKYNRGKNLFAYQVLESFDHIGRDLEKYRKETCPQRCEPNALILNGEDMYEINRIMQTIKADEKFPRRKVYQIVHQLMNHSSKAITTTQELMNKVNSNTKTALIDLDKYFNDSIIKWIHLQALWDYVGN